MSLYTIELEVIKRGRLASLVRAIKDRLGLKIRTKRAFFEGTTSSDSAVSVLKAAIAYYERRRFLIIRIPNVIKGGGFK